jgi:hypothetical protein
MAARQRETKHELEDGFVAAWDSSELDEELREKLIELADPQIDRIVIEMGGGAEPLGDSSSRTSLPSRRSGRQRRAA